MKFKVENKAGENIHQLMRKARYRFLGTDEKAGWLSYARPLGQDFYPRFHLYANEQNKELECTLHLDQRRPRYQGTTAHNADYDGELVQQEAERIKQLFENA